jgi:hypothetical protein
MTNVLTCSGQGSPIRCVRLALGEQGRRTPVPIACRPLDRISADPRQFIADLMKTRKVAG